MRVGSGPHNNTDEGPKTLQLLGSVLPSLSKWGQNANPTPSLPQRRLLATQTGPYIYIYIY